MKFYLITVIFKNLGQGVNDDNVVRTLVRSRELSGLSRGSAPHSAKEFCF